MLRSSTSTVILTLALTGFALACGDDGAPTDSGAADSGTATDSGTGDGGGSDSSVADTGPGDSGPADGGPADSGDIDGAAGDGGSDRGDSDDGGADAAVADAGAVDCTGGAACAAGFWCRPVDATGTSSECVPYAAEGAVCGGFVPAHHERRCAPGAFCLNVHPGLADAPGKCGVAATVTELLASPGTYAGRFVSVQTGWLLSTPSFCTELACSSAMPCCNSCGSEEFLADAMTDTSGMALRDPAGAGYSCSGTNCMPLATCTEPPNARYRVSGTFDASGPAIDVTNISPYP